MDRTLLPAHGCGLALLRQHAPGARAIARSGGIGSAQRTGQGRHHHRPRRAGPSPAATPAADSTTASAPAAPPAPNPPYVNPINTMWVLVTAFLAFFMQAGFMFLEAGFSRARESVNVMLEGVVDTCLCGIPFYCLGPANGFIGNEFYCLQHIPETYGITGVATLAIFLFQFAFADACSTITSDAMVGRTGF